MFRKVSKYTTECVEELKKCTWPDRKELVEATIVVTASCALLALFVFGADKIFQKLIDVIM